jgi:Icc-related predicted phosphoesterase
MMMRTKSAGPRQRHWGELFLIFAGLLLLLSACGTENPTPATGDAPPLAGVTPQPLPTRFPTPTTLPGAGDQPAPAPEANGDDGTGSGAAPPDWTFVATADTWKDNPVFRRILSDAASQGDDLVTIGGDITPQGRPEQFDDFLRVTGDYGVPVYAAPGNHDILVSAATFAQYFPLRQSFDHKNAHFMLVDTSRETLDADDLAWIEGDLAATQQPLKFVVMHVPPFMPYPVPADKQMRAGGDAFVALMTKYHVTMVLAGHLQAYARMERDGIPYIITGGGGSPPAVPAFLGGRYHYIRVAVRGSNASASVTWLDDVMPPAP